MHMLSGSSDQHWKRAESRLIIYNVEGSEIIMTASASAAGLYFHKHKTPGRHITRRNGLRLGLLYQSSCQFISSRFLVYYI
jgi:hypothetical protein